MKVKEDVEKRDYYFDNIKAIMIFLVVLGHFIEIGMYKNELFQGIWYAIYLFHMPLFIFVAGYFTKESQENAKKAIKNYLIPYIIFSIALYIFRIFILKQKVNIQFLSPQYGMWFLIIIFSYKVIYNGICKLRGIFIISIILAIIVGLDKSFTNLWAFSRTIVFLPFFIAGSKFKKEYLIKEKKYIKIILGILILVILIGVGFFCTKLNIPMNLLRSSTPYSSLKIQVEKAMLMRGVMLLLGFIVSYMILNIIPNKKIPISYIGQNTMITYILHIFIIQYCMEYNILDGNTYKTFFISIIATILIVLITSLPILKKGYDKILKGITKLLNI